MNMPHPAEIGCVGSALVVSMAIAAPAHWDYQHGIQEDILREDLHRLHEAMVDHRATDAVFSCGSSEGTDRSCWHQLGLTPPRHGHFWIQATRHGGFTVYAAWSPVSDTEFFIKEHGRANWLIRERIPENSPYKYKEQDQKPVCSPQQPALQQPDRQEHRTPGSRIVGRRAQPHNHPY
ncbi:MAG: hypothetical protein AAFV53_11050, partial [Myxococcota bacterium]